MHPHDLYMWVGGWWHPFKILDLKQHFGWAVRAGSGHPIKALGMSWTWASINLCTQLGDSEALMAASGSTQQQQREHLRTTGRTLKNT